MAATNAFREWLDEIGMTQSECARRFGIPLRTVQGWALGERECTDYTLRMMREALDARNALITWAKYRTVAEALYESIERVSAGDVVRCENCDYLTVNTGRNGHTAVWYLDAEENEACFDIDDMRFLTEEEIERDYA